MASLGDTRAQFSIDAQTVTHLNKDTTTILNSDVFDNLLSNIENAFEYEIGYVPNGFEHRPDLIANVFYGSPKNWWLLCVVNNVVDPFEGFNLGERIAIPILK